MDDLLQPQIQESCRLALPNGLKELMSDISREVLRAQPSDLLAFITDYLSALLVTREHMLIASRVCSTVCQCGCRPELEEELRFVGLDYEHAKETANIVDEHFAKGNVKEADLVMQLMKVEGCVSNLSEILTAVRNAFLKHQRNKIHVDYESPLKEDEDETKRAVGHTLAIYKQTDPGFRCYNIMATKIQAAYRAYRIRRVVSVEHTQNLPGLGSIDKSRVRFGSFASEIRSSKDLEESALGFLATKKLSEESFKKTRPSNASLAGSYLEFSDHKNPVHTLNLSNLEELRTEQICEKETQEKGFINDISSQDESEEIENTPYSEEEDVESAESVNTDVNIDDMESCNTGEISDDMTEQLGEQEDAYENIAVNFYNEWENNQDDDDA